MVKLVSRRISNKFAYNRKRRTTDCIYFGNDRFCENPQCVWYTKKCFDASYCTYRVKKQDEEIEFAYLVKKQKEQTKTVHTGIKKIPLSEIVVSKEFKKPDTELLDSSVKKYANNKDGFNGVIVVELINNQYHLLSKYLNYCIASRLGLMEISTVFLTPKQIGIERKLRKIGAIISHKTLGIGTVVAVDKTTVTVKFDSGKTLTLQIYACIQDNLILSIKNKQ